MPPRQLSHKTALVHFWSLITPSRALPAMILAGMLLLGSGGYAQAKGAATTSSTTSAATTSPTLPASERLGKSTGAANTSSATSSTVSSASAASSTAPGAPATVLTKPAKPSSKSFSPSTPAIVVAAIAALLALGCIIWAVARWRAWEPRWALSLRHALAEAGYHASATWAEVLDWARLGR